VCSCERFRSARSSQIVRFARKREFAFFKLSSVYMSCNQQNIILGVTGGIAAYKSAELCRLLKKSGADVRVVMTQGACEFIQPLTFQALSGEPVSTRLLDEDAEAGMGHIELAKWADKIIIAPASANTIARVTHGLADDLLSTLVLATEAQLILAPAMNQAMWANPVTQENIRRLTRLYGSRLQLVGPASGEQACGDVGFGRMSEPEEILEAALKPNVTAVKTISPCRVVITAGPTREAIDPVRYVSNHSSGKMGFALAEAFRQMGARVTLIAGPVSIDCHPEICRVNVESAEQMYQATIEADKAGFDIFVGAAAVADYAPVAPATNKLKKKGDQKDMVIQMKENPDIIASIASKNKPGRTVVGFAAETNDVLAYARGKLERKGLDLVIANDVSEEGIGFNSDSNQVTLVSASGDEALPKDSKAELAKQLAVKIYSKYQQKTK